MSIKEKAFLTMSSLIGTVGTAFGANNVNVSLTPNAEKGMENLASLPYVDKLVWITDTIYALVPWVAIIALGFLAVKYYLGGWDSVENELRSRRAFFSIIIIVLALKVGSSFVNFISKW